MVIDTSAILAILQDEPSRAVLVRAIDAADARVMSAATYVECSIVIFARYGSEGLRDLDHFIAVASIELVPVDVDQAHAARAGYRKFGKGRHPAGLNFGDCFSYALAFTRGERLLFSGSDFSQTDVDCHPASQS